MRRCTLKLIQAVPLVPRPSLGRLVARPAAKVARSQRKVQLPSALPTLQDDPSYIAEETTEPLIEEDASRRINSAFGKEIRATMDSHPDALVLVQVGKFYESYFEQAKTVADACRLTITRKSWTIASGVQVDLDFCGFPISALAKHLRTLVDAAGKVVIVDEVGDKQDVEGKGKRRQVSRIATPSTLLDDGLFDAGEPAYLLAIRSAVDRDDELDLAWVDPASGDCFGQPSQVGLLVDDISRIAPAEIVVSGDEPLRAQVHELAKRFNVRFDAVGAAHTCTAIELARLHLRQAWPLAFGDVSYEPEALSGWATMRLDANAFAALELRQPVARQGSRVGGLIQSIKRSLTPGGGRLLLRRISEPSTELSTITARQDLVAACLATEDAMNAITAPLKRSGDGRQALERLKHGHGQALLSRLLAIANLLQSIAEVKNTLLEPAPTYDESTASPLRVLAAALRPQLDVLKSLDVLILAASRIEDGAEELDEDTPSITPLMSAPPLSSSAWRPSLRPDASVLLAAAHERLHELAARRAQLADEVKARLGRHARLSVSLKNEPYLSMTETTAEQLRGTMAAAADDNDDLHMSRLRLVKALRSRRHFAFERWTSLYREIDAQHEAIRQLESDHLAVLRDLVLSRQNDIRRSADQLDELDVARGFAALARERSFVRPLVDESNAMVVENGRHPVVAESLLKQGREFVSNSITFDDDSPRLHLITGPNMGGKSTYLRQTALIVVLAQAGSYVPASYARIGIRDGIYTRIGAYDDLYAGQSTFMVEMLETASILRHATPRSLVIMDEVGRGTSPEEGLAISYGVIDHLLRVNRSQTLFATHFHDIIDVLARHAEHATAVDYRCTDATEHENGDWSFSHTVRSGVNRHAGALQVARYAQLPTLAIEAAQELARKRVEGKM